MGFRLSSFLGGMAEGAIEIDERVRKRNQELIDTHLTLSAERDAKALEDRKKAQETYDLLAKKLKSFEGMDDNKVNIVLAYGPEQAQQFLEEAPVRAKREGLTVADYVTVFNSSEGNLPEVSTQELIEFGTSLPGMRTRIGETTKPELQRGILTGDFTEEFESTRESIYGGMGIEVPEQRELQVPEGRINFMDLLGTGTGAEGLTQTASQLLTRAGEYFSDASNLPYEVGEAGNLIMAPEHAETRFVIQGLQSDYLSEYNRLAGQNPELATANPEQIHRIALDNVIQSMPESVIEKFPLLKIQSPAGGTPTPEAPDTAATDTGAVPSGNVRAQIQSIENDAALTDTQKKAKIRSALRSAGLAQSPQEADEIYSSGNY